jgi:hypothetical protein
MYFDEHQHFCFLEGTKILVNNAYICIENIKIGDSIKVYKETSHKVKYIVKKKISNNIDENYLSNLYMYEKNNFNNLTDDLIITGGHCILKDTLDLKEKEKMKNIKGKVSKIHDKYCLLACCDESAQKLVMESNKEYTVYQLVLNSKNPYKQFGIYANGLLCETMPIYFYNKYLK